MAIDLGAVPMVIFVAEGSTPAHLTQYAGVRILIGPGLALPAMGQFETLVISGVSVPGYLRQGAENLEWVMQPAVDPAVQALQSIPGVDGWKSTAAKNVYQNVGGALLARGISLAEVKQALTQLYQGAIANFVAAHPQLPALLVKAERDTPGMSDT